MRLQLSDPHTPRPVEVSYEIRNTDRAFGAPWRAMLALRKERESQRFRSRSPQGAAGKGFALAFTVACRFSWRGCQRCGGDSMADGGLIVVRPPADWPARRTKPRSWDVFGYGATGGEMYVRGKAPCVSMVRNSGATAVVEGVGDDACEYMTRGTVVILADDVEDIGWNCAGGLRSGCCISSNGFQSVSRWPSETRIPSR